MPARPRLPMTMFNLLRAVYWYDETLQTNLRAAGWPPVTRTQSMLFVNIALGESRPARLAEKLGMTRQSMSEMIAGLVRKNILQTIPDPDDGRAIIVRFHPDSGPLRHAAETTLHEIHQYLSDRLGPARLAELDAILATDWGEIPDLGGDKMHRKLLTLSGGLTNSESAERPATREAKRDRRNQSENRSAGDSGRR